MNASTKLPTTKVLAATLAASAATFLVDLITQVWPAFPPSGEPFFVAAFTLTVAYIIPERPSSYARVTPPQAKPLGEAIEDFVEGEG